MLVGVSVLPPTKVARQSKRLLLVSVLSRDYLVSRSIIIHTRAGFMLNVPCSSLAWSVSGKKCVQVELQYIWYKNDAKSQTEPSYRNEQTAPS